MGHFLPGRIKAEGIEFNLYNYSQLEGLLVRLSTVVKKRHKGHP